MDDSAVPTSDKHLQAIVNRMALALSFVDESIVWTDAHGRIEGCNAAFEQLINQSAAAMTEQLLSHVLPLTLKGEATPLPLQPATWGLTGTQSRAEWFEFHRHDRSFRLAITVAPLPDVEDDPAAGTMLVIRDVTTQPERQQTETILRDDRWFHGVFDTSAVGMVIMSVDGVLMQANAAFCQMLGYTQAELAAKTCQQFVHPDDFEGGLEPLRKLLAGELLVHHTERRYSHKKGHVVWGLLSLSVVRNVQQQALYVVYQVQDITDRKQAELALQQLNQELEQRVQKRTAQLEQSNQQLQAEIVAHEQTEAALRKNEERFRVIFDLAPIAISLADIHTCQIVDLNQAYYELFGYAKADLGTLTYIDVIHPDDVAQNRAQNQQLLEGKTTRFQLEERLVKKNGDWLWANLTVALIRDPDGQTYSMGMIEDITDRKRSEEALRDNQQLLELVIDSVPSTIFWKDKNLRYLGCNQQFAIDAGVTAPKDIIGKTDVELPWAAHIERCQVEDLHVLKSNQPTPVVEGLLVKAGEQRWIKTGKVPLRGKNGSAIGILGMYEDITERRQTDQALRLTQFSIDRAADPIWWIEPDSRIYYVNDAACRDLGYPRDMIIGKHVPDFNPDLSFSAWADHWNMIKEKGSYTFEAPIRAKDGTLFLTEVTSNYIELNGKEYHCSFVRNITKRKQAEEQLKASLAEKEILLKEVHHRVKNNLQTVCSLLNLQANTIQDPNVLAPFQDSQRRIKAMALIHERLYQSESLAKVNFSDYVAHLVTELLHSYGIDRARIRLTLELLQLELPVSAAIPCGLIINELVTNALKYAFPDDRTGEIKICFSSSHNQYLLVVADDGVGFLTSMAVLNHLPHADSLGLQLVHAFVHQLRGTVELDCSRGTRIELSFPHPG